MTQHGAGDTAKGVATIMTRASDTIRGFPLQGWRQTDLDYTNQPTMATICRIQRKLVILP